MRAGDRPAAAADQAEVAALLAEENVELLSQEEADRLTQLDALTVCCHMPRSTFATHSARTFKTCWDPQTL
jgi:hypothetical protein